jgi:heptosyltransferase-2
LKDKLRADQIGSLVVRAPNWVGDAVICLPALRALRRLLPDKHITLVSRPGSADIFIDADFIDEILIYDRGGLRSAAKQIREWKRRRFDLAVLFQNAFQAAAIAFLAQVPARIGYDTDRRGFLLTHPISVPGWKNGRHEIFYYLNIVGVLERALFGKSDFETVDPEFALSVSEDRKRKARKLVEVHGAQAGRPLVLLCPGSVNSRAKRWPPERYAAVAERFDEIGATVALIGSPDELEVSEEVCARTRRDPLVLTGETSVAEVTALISIADVLITNDTGPAHIGAALGTPTVVIFGPTNPLTTRPFGPAGVMIRHQPDCAPCMLRDCPIDHRCMTAITPEEVFDRALRSMRQSVGTSV